MCFSLAQKRNKIKLRWWPLSTFICHFFGIRQFTGYDWRNMICCIWDMSHCKRVSIIQSVALGIHLWSFGKGSVFWWGCFNCCRCRMWRGGGWIEQWIERGWWALQCLMSSYDEGLLLFVDVGEGPWDRGSMLEVVEQATGSTPETVKHGHFVTAWTFCDGQKVSI